MILSAQDSVMPSMSLVTTARKAQPKIQDQQKKYDVKSSADHVAEVVQKLMEACRNYAKSAGGEER